MAGPRPALEQRSVAAAGLGLIFGYVLWATTPLVFGIADPWGSWDAINPAFYLATWRGETPQFDPYDTLNPYYYLALVLGGFACALVQPRRQWIHLLALIAGQGIFMLLHRPLHAWLIVGLLIMAVLTAVLAGLGGLLALPKRRVLDD
jgi:hypothetical protein